MFAVKGITPTGDLTDAEPLEAEVKRSMIAYARTVVLLATATKFEDRGLNLIVPASAVGIAYLAAYDSTPRPAGICS